VAKSHGTGCQSGCGGLPPAGSAAKRPEESVTAERNQFTIGRNTHGFTLERQTRPQVKNVDANPFSCAVLLSLWGGQIERKSPVGEIRQGFSTRARSQLLTAFQEPKTGKTDADEKEGGGFGDRACYIIINRSTPSAGRSKSSIKWNVCTVSKI
jgi:hypothetical protein